MANYLREPFSADLDFGTGEWSVGSWVNIPTSNASAGTILSRSYSTGPSITLSIDATSKIVATVSDGINQRTVTTDAAYNSGTWIKAEATYKSGKLAILVNGVEVKSTVGAPLLSLNSRYNNHLSTNVWSVATNGATVSTVQQVLYTGISGDVISMLEQTGTGVHRIYWGATTFDGCISVHVKPNGRNYVTLNGSASGGYATFDLTGSGSVTQQSGVTTPQIQQLANGWYRISMYDTSVNQIVISTNDVPTFTPDMYGSSTTVGNTSLGVYLWGAQLETGTTVKPYQRVGSVATDFDFQAPLTIGNNYALNAPFPGSLALVKLSATVPTAEQAQWMYNQEKQMFQPNAQITLPDSNAIQDISYDDLTDTWVAASTTNISYWNGLVRTNSVPVPAGTYSKLASGSGIHLSARTTTNQGVDITIPDYNVRTKIKKKSEKGKKNSTAVFDYMPIVFTNATLTNGSNTMTCSTVTGTPYVGMIISGTGITPGTTILGINGTSYYLSTTYSGTTGSTYTVGQTSFDLPVGYTANLVYSNGSIKREGSTKDWTRVFDGFKETVIFGTSPGNVSVQIHCQTT